MRFLVCLVSIVILATTLALTDDIIAKRDKISKECRKVSPVSDEVLSKARQHHLEDDPKLKKYVFCVTKKVGLANEEGDTIVDALKRKLKKVTDDDEEVDQIAQKCVVKKDTPEETAFENLKCLFSLKPELQIVE